jgi:precorrin-2 methylase
MVKATKKVEAGTPADERKRQERDRLRDAGGGTVSIKLERVAFETLNEIIASKGETKQEAIARLIMEEGKKIAGKSSKK